MSRLIGHEAVLRELASLATGPEPAHAVLLAGPDGLGRSALAMEYACLLNCEAMTAGEPGSASPAPCGACRPCRLIAHQTHPDVVRVGPGDALCRPRPGDSGHEAHPESRDIRICQVRGMIDLVARYPLEARYRVIIIEPAERLGREAGHTLLKTLEEPPGHSAFVLVSGAPEALLETIQSRCRRIDVGLVGRAEIEAGLVARGYETRAAAAAAAAAAGRPARALAFAASPAEMDIRVRLLERCERVASDPRPSGRLSYAGDLADRWRRDPGSVTAELSAWEAFWEARLRELAPFRSSEAVGALAALKAVRQARDDLGARVLSRPALELMLLRFPRATLGERTGSDQAPAHV